MTQLLLTRYGAAEPPSLRHFDVAARVVFFRVLEGSGAWIGLVESSDDTTIETVGSALAGPRDTIEQLHFTEIFAASEARSFSESNRYIFLVRIEIDEELAMNPEFNRWYNEQHVPDVGKAGLLRGRRFHSQTNMYEYMASYDMRDRWVLESEGIARVRGFAQFAPSVRYIERVVLERADMIRPIR